MDIREFLDVKWKEFIRNEAAEGRTVDVTDFAVYLGVNYQSLKQWMNGIRKPRDKENINALAAKFGREEVYRVLGYDIPKLQIPDEVWDALSEKDQDEVIEFASQKAAGRKVQNLKKEVRVIASQ